MSQTVTSEKHSEDGLTMYAPWKGVLLSTDMIEQGAGVCTTRDRADRQSGTPRLSFSRREHADLHLVGDGDAV